MGVVASSALRWPASAASRGVTRRVS